MALTKSELEAVVRELAAAVVGGKIQKISQPAPHAFLLDLRAPGRTHRLLLSADPATGRIHLCSSRLPNPPAPPPFCQFLRAHLQGGRLEQVAQVNQDRIVRLDVTARDGRYGLILELTGPRSDLHLVDAEGRILLSVNRGRERTGQRYAPPPAPPEGYWTEGYCSEGYRKSEAFPIETPDQPSRSSPFPVSAMIEARYQAQEADLARERLRQARLVGLRKAIKRHRKRIESFRADLAKADRYREYGRYGELLKATLSAVQKGQDRVTVVDYFDPALPELVIPLDPAKTPQANMEDYFKKHRKQLTAEREIRPRLAATEQELEALQQEIQAVQQPDWTPPPTIGVRPHARSRGQAAVPAATRPKGRSGPFRKFVSEDGTPIYVGRNANENEELTFKVARSDDLWLHARGTPGSHVVVRLDKGTDPSLDTLKDATMLAVHYSDFRKSGKGEVIYTRRKWVRKAKGQPPGTVTVTQEKTLFVQLERTRLARLKHSNG